MGSQILRVSSKSVPTSVAGAILGVVREAGAVQLHAVGAAAANQAIKSVAIARTYMAESGMDLICVPEFTNVTIGEEERSAISLTVLPR